MLKMIITPLSAVLVLTALAGCGGVNVEASGDEGGAHRRLIEEEDGGRTIAMTRPRVVEVPKPAFPSEPPEAGIAGLIMVRVLVGVDGLPVEATVSQPLHPELDKAALAAAMAGQYEPAREGEIPREAWLPVPFRYPQPAPPVED